MYSALHFCADMLRLQTLALIPKTKKNIIVTSSSSYQTISRLITTLKMVIGKDSSYDIALFGHPDWQAYTQLYPDFVEFNTYIYTSFFADRSDSVKNLETAYQTEYKKNMPYTFPRYPILGYDIANYFIPALSNYGMQFENNLSSIRCASLQTPFYFVKTGESGGYQNEGLYLVHFSVIGVERFDRSKE